MALKALMLRKKINDKSAQLDELRKKNADFAVREKELEDSVNEAATDEERAVVDSEIDKFDSEKTAHEEAIKALEEEIRALENELQELEKEPSPAPEASRKERTEEKAMAVRKKFFGMNTAERDAFFARAEVKEFLQRTRELGSEKRALTGGDLSIPTVVLELVRENIAEYSKLYKHVNARPVPGKARQVIMGTIPEAIWTEMCAKLNELDLVFNAVEVDGYKVGAYIGVCNAILKDSDIALATEIITALGQAIGRALDKAILYGTGEKMPLGIVTRLAQTAKPSGYPAIAPTWANLTANLVAITSKSDAALFKAIVEASGKASSKYSSGTKFWAMNELTYTKLMANALSINAAGAVTTGISGTMPVVGGAIETLDFIPNDVIIGGYGDLYLLAEREDITIGQSEHVRFIEDQTVFKAIARYDGVPAIANGFVAIGIAGTAPTASAVTFTEDTANATSSGGAGGSSTGDN